MKNMEQIPVFVINGFLESGKTSFMKFTMEQEYFQAEGKTLLIVCEEGEKEYSLEFLEKYDTQAIYINEQENFDLEELRKVADELNPERILIEWNGMWLQDGMKLPDTWFINQMISIFDTSTLDLYLKNMKAYMGPMLKNTELLICNRADNIEEDKLASYYMQLRAMAPNSEIVFEGKDGEIRGDFSIELPYNLEEEHLDIKPEYYGIFYIDSMDRPNKYAGKTVEFTAQVLKPDELSDNIFVPVRRAMTCCENDMQYLGLVCYYEGAKNLKRGSWVKVRAELKYEYCKAYSGEGPVLYAKEVLLTGPIKEVVQFG